MDVPQYLFEVSSFFMTGMKPEAPYSLHRGAMVVLLPADA
ncbi:hypothetical protein JOC33_000960 [Thalassobacillus pellis]|nr:hypothetical protein [Thalassobacillus pellis]